MEIEICTTCNGTGSDRYSNYACNTCGGSGEITTSRDEETEAEARWEAEREESINES